MSRSRILNKRLYQDIAGLKRLNTEDAEVRFKVVQSPFSDEEDDDDDMPKSVAQKECGLIGLIYPQSNIYKDVAFKIKIIFPQTFPMVPPTVTFVTPIYHPNVTDKGEFCNELLTRNSKWLSTTSLLEVVKIVTQHIDEPDSTNPIRAAVGVEYTNNRAQFESNAREHALKYGEPRK
ncbi:unnamed protein product [Adineta ricciae]|uniref:UBC core domain-containing protein n=1 Tax=Adineta ricciae TaxID=249248 RepID=A0A814NEN1_ADIRI|nr:unnamed protein product [Adineta ricciae]CAF1092053.1 unnamed protein product [Adineta ricciae]